MDNKEGWWERIRDIRADGMTWWWRQYTIFKTEIVQKKKNKKKQTNKQIHIIISRFINRRMAPMYIETPDTITYMTSVTWWLTETRRWEWYSPPVELKLSSSQKVTVRNECGSHRCSHLSDLGSPDIGRGRRKWSQMIGGGTPKRKWGSLPLNGSKYKKG